MQEFMTDSYYLVKKLEVESIRSEHVQRMEHLLSKRSERIKNLEHLLVKRSERIKKMSEELTHFHNSKPHRLVEYFRNYGTRHLYAGYFLKKSFNLCWKTMVFLRKFWKRDET